MVVGERHRLGLCAGATRTNLVEEPRTPATTCLFPSLSLPQVVLGTVADAAGVQAVRHTFQVIQTALQTEVALTARAGRGGRITAACTEAAGREDGEAAGAAAGRGPTMHHHNAAGDSATAVGGVGSNAIGGGTREFVEVLPAELSTTAFNGMPVLASPLARQRKAAPPLGTLGHTLGGSAEGPPSLPPADAAAAAVAAPVPLPAGHLRMALEQAWCGNAVLVKLIAPVSSWAQRW